MSRKFECDFCKKIVNQCISVKVEEESPHNGDLYWSEKDICFDCLLKTKELHLFQN